MKTSTEQALENAKKYVEKGVNIEGKGFLHFDDWNGTSGHPKWVKNKLIPTLEKTLSQREKKRDKRKDKAKDRAITERKNDLLL